MESSHVEDVVVNPLGDVELDARGIRALAHPVRLAILQRLRREGPSTATRLAPLVGASPSVTSWHLRHLAEHGLVEDAPDGGGGGRRTRWWRASGSGFRFDVDPDDPAPGLALRGVIEAEEGDVVGTWTRSVRPRLEPEWLTVSTRWDTGVVISRDELQQLSDAMEALLAPLATRPPSAAPEGARRVRVLRYALPDAAS